MSHAAPKTPKQSRSISTAIAPSHNDSPRPRTVRLAAVQITVDPRARAANLRSAIAAMESAAQRDPSPDVFVLPAFVDLVGPLRLSDSIPEPLAGPTCAALAATARELGVYIAFGMAEWHKEGPFAAAALLDPDGDVILAHRQLAIPRTQRKAFKSGVGVKVRSTMIGAVALLMRDDLLSEDAWKQVRAAGAQFVLGCTAWPATKPAASSDLPSRIIAKFAKASGACVVLADTVIIGDVDTKTPGDTCAISSDGTIVEAAPPGATHVCIISAACAAKVERAPLR